MASRSSRKKPGRSQRTLRNVFSAIFAFSAVFSGFAQTLPERARTEALARRAAERLQALQREADRLASDERTLIGDLRKVELERQIKAEELKRVDSDAAKVQVELDQTRSRLGARRAARTAAASGGDLQARTGALPPAAALDA
jgi:hypothetical protein